MRSIKVTFIFDVRVVELPQKKTKFILYSDEQIKAKQMAGKNINTTRTEERANQAFRRFLSESGEMNLDYWLYEEPELDNYLSKFWFSARKAQSLIMK